LLTADQKRTRMKIFEQCLERFNENKIDFGWDLDSPLHTRIQIAVKRVDCTKEDKVGSISRKCHVICVLGY
jgi:hypothetical protein